MRVVSFVLVAFVCSAWSILVGCSRGPESPTADPHAGGSSHTHAAHAHSHAGEHAHAHDELGPHGGHLIELGHSGNYHAELLEDFAAGRVVVYILDGRLQPLAIDAPAIVLTITAAGKTTAHELAAAGDEGAGGYSRFESSDPALLQAMEQSSVSGNLRVTIAGVPYVGRLAHRSHGAHELSGHR